VLTIPHADRALQHEKLLGEAAQNIQRRILVGQEHIAPHGRIAGRDPGEIAKPEAEYLMTSEFDTRRRWSATPTIV
jgi:hypothetical protein